MFFKRSKTVEQKTRSPFNRKTKIATSIILVFLFLQIASPIFYPKPAQAQFTDPVAAAQRTGKWIWDKVQKIGDYLYKHGAALAFKNAIKTITTKIAYDTAVWIGSGDSGQKPLLYTKNWESYLRDTADAAAGDFMETLGKGTLGINLCQPFDLNLRLKLYLGLGQEIQPRKPECKWSEMRKDWGKAISDPNFLKNFSLAFEPTQNDIGVYLNLSTSLMESKTARETNAQLDRLGKWVKDVVSPVANLIETPAGMSQEQVNKSIKDSTKSEETFTGDIWADTITVFTNTLVANLMKRMQKGFWSLADLVDEENSGGLPPGGKAAKEAFTSLGVVNIKVGGEYDVVSQFSFCPGDTKYAATDNCVVDTKLANILSGGDYKTIKQAINDGNLHGDWLVAEKGLKDQPSDYLNRYSLTNVKKLRKALIVPLGLEIAAEKIFSGAGAYYTSGSPYYTSGASVPGNYTLNDIVNGFDDNTSPFYHLVDPDWVLKAPLMYCRAKVFGPIPESESNYRQEACVDEQHCISENPDKSCNAWGYCTKEKNVWVFKGDSCPSYYNTCQTFNRRDGRTFSYLTNTLDKGECDANSVGCKWYSQSQTGSNWNQNDKIYFNKNVETCSQNQAGCHEFLQLTDIIDNKSVTDAYNAVQAASDDAYENYSTVNKIYLNSKRTACSVKELGCELYTPLSRSGESPVPAIVKSTDFCPSECVGYRNYKEVATFFDSGQDPVALIAQKAKSCSVQNVGCEEFTNLDTVAQGGEGKESYSYLRQCQKPDNSCATFYTWVGSETSGFQLKSYELKSAGGVPQTTDNSGACCDPNLPSNDPESCAKKIVENPDCKEFYTSAGQIYYRYFSKTITCSNDCHPLRKTYSTQSDCAKTGGSWNGQDCIYMALPSQGTVCPAAAAGCREYKGNTGTNYRILIDDNFEDNTNQNWVGTPSNEATKFGGHSLNVDNATLKEVLPTKDKSYILSFWAKGGGMISAVIQKTGSSLSFGSINSSADDWNYYTLGPVNFSDDVSGDEKIAISGTGSFFLDNIILKEISDSVYLIKNSWTIPTTCDTPYQGAQLNCEEYRDRAGKQNFIKSFSSICGEDKVGCELLVDTQNSDSPYQENFAGGVTVLNDQLVYMVNDAKKYCNGADKGCTAYGLPELDANEQVKNWTNIYLKNNPNNYKGTNPILCEAKYQSCEEFTSGQAKEYFKDPEDKACDFRTNVNVGGVLKAGWFKKGTNDSCDLDNNQKPDSGWAGLCKEQYSGCAQYNSYAEGQNILTGDSYYYLDNNKLEYCNSENWKDGCVKFSSIINFSNPVQTKDSLLSVRKDRVCSEWLSCMSKYSVWDKNSNRYKDVCTQLGRCNALQAGGNSAECASWVLSAPQKLTEAVYKSRDVSWKGEDYSGYSLYNFYPLDRLKARNYSSTNDPRWRLTYVAPNNSDQGLLGNCGANDSCPNGFVCENNLCVASKICRGFPESTSPFSSTSDYTEVNKFESGEGEENQCDYEKISYTSGDVKYYDYQSEKILSKICSGGDADKEGKECTSNAGCGENGQCVSKKKQNILLGWHGYCLEPDSAKNPDLNACLTWWPTDMSAGDADLYGQFVNAGFNPGGVGLGDGPYYCVAKTPASYEWREGWSNSISQGACGWVGGLWLCLVGGCKESQAQCPQFFHVEGPNCGNNLTWDCQPDGGVGCYIKDTSTNVNIPQAYCTNNFCSTFVKAADNTNNKAWTDRLWKDQRDPKYNTPTYNYNSECGVFARLPNNDAGNASKIIIFTDDEKRCTDQGNYYLASKDYSSISDELKGIFAKSYGLYTWNGTNYVYSATGGSSWDTTFSAGVSNKAPKIFSVIQNPNNGTYYQGQEGKFTVNNQESGDIVGRAGTVAVILRFYASANENQMPIKYRGVDWVDGNSDGADGLYKNQQAKCLKSCKNNPSKSCSTNSECGQNDTCLPINFGNNPEACSEAYVQFSKVYTCPAGSSNLQSCPIDANGAGAGNGQCCVFKPKVMIKDNWGWCNGGAYVGDVDPCPGQEFSGKVIVIP